MINKNKIFYLLVAIFLAIFTENSLAIKGGFENPDYVKSAYYLVGTIQIKASNDKDVTYQTNSKLLPSKDKGKTFHSSSK